MQSKMSPSFIDIRTMAVMYGVSHRTLRFYEDRALLAPKREGTARLYSRRDQVRLQIILKGKKLGLSLSEIENLIRDQKNQPRPVEEEAEKAFLANRMGRRQIQEQLQIMRLRRADLDQSIDELEAVLGELPADNAETA